MGLQLNRRRVLTVVGASAVGVTSGCLSGGDGPSESSDGGSVDGESADDTGGGLRKTEPGDQDPREPSRERPLGHGERGSFGDRELVVHSVLLGDDAADEHVGAHPASNDRPPAGETYVLVDVEVADPDDGAIETLGLTMSVVAGNETYARRDGATCRGDETAQLGAAERDGHYRETRCLSIPTDAAESGVLRLDAVDDSAVAYAVLRPDVAKE
ncbi:hypothetical protein [Halovivax cerinus]|uniref:Uncharacterized protein n=1 Tax=Halovivax cerinus TaxID=1487865 RepID=A0ABD5NSY8_9EURY|nr:hypothetical protein [Halovivax cerinus]